MGRVAALFILGLSSCRSEPAGPDVGPITIRTEEDSYRWAHFDRGGEIKARLTNRSGGTLYSSIGDRMAGPVQDRLYAMGADSRIEREVGPGVWRGVATPLLIEGSRIVRLAPEGRYLIVGLVTDRVDGNYRIRVRIFRNDDGSDPAADAMSNPFTIRR